MKHSVHVTSGLVDLYPTRQNDGSWHVALDGKHYCAATLETLERGLELHFHVVKPAPVTITKPPVQRYREILTSESSSLMDKQAARRDLIQFANNGHPEASDIVARLRAKPAPSLHARTWTAVLGKTHFEDVTHEDLVENVSDLVLRSKLILELAERFTL